MARPTKFTNKAAEQFCEAIASGVTLQAASAAIDVTPSTIYNWMNAHSKFNTLYRQARLVQAALAMDQLAELEEQVVDKQIEASAFRALLDSRKWRVGQINNLYGTDVHTESAIDVAVELRKRMEKLHGKRK